MQPSQRPRFVSGKFVWDYDGHKLVKDAGKHAIATFHLEREKSATQPQIKLLSLLLGKYRSSLGTDNLHGLALFRLLILMNNDKQAHTHTHTCRQLQPTPSLRSGPRRLLHRHFAGVAAGHRHGGLLRDLHTGHGAAEWVDSLDRSLR